MLVIGLRCDCVRMPRGGFAIRYTRTDVSEYVGTVHYTLVLMFSSKLSHNVEIGEVGAVSR